MKTLLYFDQLEPLLKKNSENDAMQENVKREIRTAIKKKRSFLMNQDAHQKQVSVIPMMLEKLVKDHKENSLLLLHKDPQKLYPVEIGEQEDKHIRFKQAIYDLYDKMKHMDSLDLFSIREPYEQTSVDSSTTECEKLYKEITAESTNQEKDYITNLKACDVNNSTHFKISAYSALKSKIQADEGEQKWMDKEWRDRREDIIRNVAISFILKTWTEQYKKLNNPVVNKILDDLLVKHVSLDNHKAAAAAESNKLKKITKIQSLFRGHLGKKKAKKVKENSASEF
jgi:hypothetical protein